VCREISDFSLVCRGSKSLVNTALKYRKFAEKLTKSLEKFLFLSLFYLLDFGRDFYTNFMDVLEQCSPNFLIRDTLTQNRNFATHLPVCFHFFAIKYCFTSFRSAKSSTQTKLELEIWNIGGIKTLFAIFLAIKLFFRWVAGFCNFLLIFTKTQKKCQPKSAKKFFLCSIEM
jgi:hypothetical protein